MLRLCKSGEQTIPAVLGVLLILLFSLLSVYSAPAQARNGVGGAFDPVPLLPPPTVPPQFDLTGFIQEATLDTTGSICQPSDPRLAGGTFKVNGINVIVPCNTILQMPAATLTWQELFSLAPRDIGLPVDANGVPTQTGLAQKDTVSMPLATAYNSGPLPSYEIHVLGNVVDGKYIAGLIFISQQELNLGQGTITAIDYSNGELQIATKGPTPGVARVRINDPIGRYGLSHGAPGSGAAIIEPGYDVRFSIDEESPTIHAATGYPMCIPRSDPFNDADDPLCPQANRPRAPNCLSLPAPFPAFTMPAAGQYCTSFMMPPPPRNPCTSGDGFTCPPDPTQQAPFEVGDTINFLGTLKVDSRGPYISAHTIDGKVGIYTTPGIMPAYLTIEMELQGTAALPVGNLPQEATSRLKVVGFSTDPSNLVDIYAVDVDPQSGALSERLLGAANPSGPPVIGRFRFVPAAGAFLPPPRELRVVSRTLCNTPGQPCKFNGSGASSANGLFAGQYHAPNFEFIFAENLIQGDALVPANLQDFAFLYCGSGPLWTPTGGEDGPVVGQLDPAPWAPPMADPVFASTLCPTTKKVSSVIASGSLAPLARAVAAPASAASTQTVTLSAATSADQNVPPRPLTYRWVQTGGPAVFLSNAILASPVFIAPVVSAPVTLSFEVTVSNDIPLASTATVTVTVSPAATPPAANISAPFSVPAGSQVTLSGTVSNGSIFSWVQTTGPLVVLTGADTLTPSFIAPAGPAALTFVLSATGSNGASATVSRIISVLPDTVTLGIVNWSNSNGRGKLNAEATSSLISTTAQALELGVTMTATFWSSNIPEGIRGSATNPISADMSLVQDLLICGTVKPCFSLNLDGVIADQRSAPNTPIFVPPSVVVVKSSLGGSSTVSGTNIRIR